MELRHLRTFLAVAETLNISAAARHLRVTQPALSRHIRDLEGEIGHPLFIRNPSGLRLTVAGLALRDNGTKAVEAFDEALRAAKTVASEAESAMRIGYYGSVSLWATIMAPAFEKLRRRYPQMTPRMIELSCAQLAIDLKEGLLDVALLGPGDYGRIPGVVIETACTLFAYAMMPANHRLAKKRLIGIDELRDEVIVGVSKQDAPGRDNSLIAACKTAGFTPRILNEATTLPELIMAVKQHMGIAILGSLAMNTPHPGMVFVKLKPPGVLLELYSAYAENSRAPAKELSSLIIDECARYYPTPDAK
jgi:DNA-binding transcriptional LysR family regulator